jgi:hypothetical protein
MVQKLTFSDEIDALVRPAVLDKRLPGPMEDSLMNRLYALEKSTVEQIMVDFVKGEEGLGAAAAAAAETGGGSGGPGGAGGAGGTMTARLHAFRKLVSAQVREILLTIYNVYPPTCLWRLYI